MSSIIHKHPANPILTAAQLPYPGTLTYNCGVCKFRGRYLMFFRVDHYADGGGPGTKSHPDFLIGRAWSDDGLRFQIDPEPAFEGNSEEEHRVYDPRVQVVDDTLYLCYATDTRLGIRSGLAASDDGRRFDRLYLSEPDNRNAVLFPERINGLLTRLDRPFARIYDATRPYDLWLSQSPDGRFWGNHKPVLAAADNPWSNDKIGPGTPPIRTPAGWLSLYHGVTLDPGAPAVGWKNNWSKLYRAGAMLLDLDEPHKIIGISPEPVLVPDQSYELPAGGGMRPNVVFPGGLIAESEGTCKIYWGAADSVVAMGTAKIAELVATCSAKPGRRSP